MLCKNCVSGRVLLAAAALLFGLSESASAQFSITMSLDENCHGTFTNTNGFFSPLPCTIQADPGPGGLPAVLTYGMLSPPGLTAGDLLLQETVGASVILSDVIRFNPNENCSGTTGCLLFYSDIAGGVDGLADTGFPTANYTNTLLLTEVGPEGANGITYTPTAGQPGFITGAGGPVTYKITSDAVPEPASVLLVACAAGLIWLKLRRRKARA